MPRLIKRMFRILLKKRLTQNKTFANILYSLRSRVRSELIDKLVIQALIKMQVYTLAKSIISDHTNKVEISRFLEMAERFAALEGEPNENRLNYAKDKYDELLKVTKQLVERFPNDYRMHDRLAKNYVAGGYRDNARYHFSQSLRLQRKQMLREQKTGLIVFMSMPRSGSGFVEEALIHGLGLSEVNSNIQFVDSWFPDYGILTFPQNLSKGTFSPMLNGILTGHGAALEPNLWNLSLVTDKLVVNFRDPRQALISWAHYMEYLRFTGNMSGLLQYRLPNGYFQWSFGRQLDWQIDNYFVPVNVEWIRGWLDARHSCRSFFDILITQYELLVLDPNRYFQDILSFYGLPADNFDYQKPEFARLTHKRAGEIDEWVRVLNDEQLEKINSYIPEKWFEQFRWRIS